jgi:bifunctional DNA-binding transcriptional regulator/antitoxin component of YhaV-PrlF toxin-antitoxin module
VTIPTSIRRSLGLVIGDVLQFSQKGEQIIVTIEPQLPDGERLAHEMGYASAVELARALEEGGRAAGQEACDEAELWMATGEEAWRKVNPE